MIKDTLKQIKEKQEILNRELVVDQRTLATQIGNRDRAESDLKDLFLDLRREVLENALVIIAHGKHAESFAKIASESFGCFDFDARSPFEELSVGIHDTYIGMQSTPDVINLFMEKFSEKASQLQILGYNYPMFQQADSYVLKDRNALVALITNVVNRDIGGEFAILCAIHDAAKRIMASDFEGSKVPVILYTENKELAETLERDGINVVNKVYLLETSKKQTEEMVEKQLLNIKKSLN